MTKIKCTGLKCPMQVGKVDPATCKAAGTCAWTTKPLTNADRIRAMTDEELDHFLGDVQWDVANCCGGVTEKQEYPVPEKRGRWLDYLKQEVKDNA